MNEKKLYSVKEVLELCNITRKQLYFYEEKGFVTPVRNEENRYRYYSDKQMVILEFVRDFRDLGFSFDSIKNMLDHPTPKVLRNSIRKAMTDAREQLDESIARYERRMTRFTTMLEASSLLTAYPSQIEREHIPSANIIYYDFSGTFLDDPIAFYTQYSKLDKLINTGRYTRTSPKRLCFSNAFNPDHSINEDKQNIRIFYAIREEASDNSHFMKTEETDVLSLIHIGSFKEPLVHSYQRIVDYAADHHLELAPVSFEEYLIDPAISYPDSSLWVTKVSIPILT